MKLSVLISTAVLGAAVVTGCGDDEEEPVADAPVAEAPADQAAADEPATEEPATDVAQPDLLEVIENPGEFEGERIRLTGDVEGQTASASVFDLTMEQGERAVVVVPTNDAGDVASVVSADRATVEGEIVRTAPDLVDRFDLAFEDEQNSGPVLDEIEEDFVLVADRVKPAE